MKSRELLLLLLGVLVLAGAIAALTGLGSGDPVPPPGTGLPPVGVEQEPGGPAPSVVDPTPAPTPTPPTKVEAEPVRETVDTAGWTSGVVIGDIQLAASIVSKIESISVTVKESRRPHDEEGNFVRPWSRTIAVEMSIGTPSFEIRDIPFSIYGYSVRCFSPGLNGSEQVVRITEDSPYQQVVLGISPGTVFSILLRDQFQAPVPDMAVTMLPVGEPPGRPTHRGKADNYGSLAFQDVLAGDYQIVVGYLQQPLVEPVATIVQPPGRSRRAQAQTIEIPRGEPLTVAVTDTRGGGLEGATVKVLPTARVQWSPMYGTTDFSGRYTFSHLPAGRYQIDVYKQNWSRRAKTVTIEAGVPTKELQFSMVPLR